MGMAEASNCIYCPEATDTEDHANLGPQQAASWGGHEESGSTSSQGNLEGKKFDLHRS